MRISACVPIFNTPPPYLRDLIKSVLSQDYTNFELVLCDDASSVDYSPVLDQYRADCRVRYVRNEQNLGMVGNWNASVRYSTGHLAIVLGHDDMVAPDMFTAYAEAFSRSSDIVLVTSGSQFIGAEGEPLEAKVNVNHRSNIFVDKREYILDGRDVAYLCLRNGAALGELSVQMFRRSAFDAVDGFDRAYRHGADVDLAIRIARLGRTIYLNRPLLLRRLHDHNLTWTNLAVGHVSRERALRFERHKNLYDFQPAELARFRAYLVACAGYDVLRIRRHKSVRVAGEALRQMCRYFRPHSFAYIRLLREIATGQNLDRR